MERAGSYNSLYSNLIKVEEPLRNVRFAVFATDPKLALNGWDSLKGTNYQVDSRLGLKRCEEMLSGVVIPDNIGWVTEPKHGIRKLIAGRIDLYIDRESVVMRQLKAKEFNQAPVYQVGVLEELTTYAFLHKQHQAFVPKLDSVFKMMKAEGLFKKYDALIFQHSFK